MRSAGEGSVRLLPNGRYEASMMVAGRRISRSGATRKEALQRLKESAADGVPLPKSGSRTVADAIRVHLEHLDSRVAQGNLKKSTRDYYERMLKHAPSAKLDALSPSFIEKWQLELADKSGSTRRGAFIALKAALKTARRDGLTTADPMADLEAPSGAREREPQHATREDLDALLANAPEP